MAVTKLAGAQLDLGPGATQAAVGNHTHRGSGSAFPGSPATGDLFYRTDRHREYYWDAARWLSTHQHLTGTNTYLTLNPMSATGYPIIFNVPGSWAGLWIDNVDVSAYQSVAGSGTNYWTIDVLYAGQSGFTGALATVDTKTIAVTTWTPMVTIPSGGLSPNPLLPANYCVYYLICTPHGAPGSLYVTSSACAREVG